MKGNHHRPLLVLLVLTIAAVGASALNVGIAQIDASDLLLGQRVGAYVSVTDDNGEPVTGLQQDGFRLFESPDGLRFQGVPRVPGLRAQCGSERGDLLPPDDRQLGQHVRFPRRDEDN